MTIHTSGFYALMNGKSSGCCTETRDRFGFATARRTSAGADLDGACHFGFLVLESHLGLFVVAIYSSHGRETRYSMHTWKQSKSCDHVTSLSCPSTSARDLRVLLRRSCNSVSIVSRAASRSCNDFASSAISSISFDFAVEML
jgi:hypothetical protein